MLKQTKCKKYNVHSILHDSEKNLTQINQFMTIYDIITNNFTCNVSTETFTDLEFFSCFDIKSTNNVLSLFLQNMNFKESTRVLEQVLSKPIFNIPLLNNRSSYLTELSKVYHDNQQYMDNTFIDIKLKIPSVLWVFNYDPIELDNVLNLIYFNNKFLDKLNNHPSILTTTNLYNMIISPVIGILSPLIYYVIPFLILRMKFNLNISLKDYLTFSYSSFTSSHKMFSNNSTIKTFTYISYILSFCVYFQGIWNNIQLSKNTFNITNFIIHKINNVIDIINHETQLQLLLRTTCDTNNNPFIKIPTSTINTVSTSCITFGNQLAFFKTLDHEKLKDIIDRIYVIDCFISLIKTKQLHNFQFATYVQNRSPSLKCDKIYHINLTQKSNIISNNFNLGNNHKNNCIITGPNAGGKSTFLKSIFINIILSQTVCFGSFNNLTFTPFKYINTHINIPDCKGVSSLFESEMYRCKDNINNIKNLKVHEFGITAMDEIFNSTNVIEGISGAYAILKTMNKYTNVLNIVTTHFSYLTKLKKHGFELYKMNANITNTNIKYSYKITSGVSKQYIALDILKDNGFDNDIIEEAIKIKTHILNIKK